MLTLYISLSGSAFEAAQSLLIVKGILLKIFFVKNQGNKEILPSAPNQKLSINDNPVKIRSVDHGVANKTYVYVGSVNN